MYNVLSNEVIISTHHSGFRSLHSTVTALLEATDNWAFNIDRGNVNAVVFLDFKKAFDTVDRDILYLKWAFTEYKKLLSQFYSIEVPAFPGYQI